MGSVARFCSAHSLTFTLHVGGVLDVAPVNAPKSRIAVTRASSAIFGDLEIAPQSDQAFNALGGEAR